jgi:hypothetical protein
MGREDLSGLGGWQGAQAMEFIRTLRVQLLEMTRQLTWIERQDVTGRNARAYAMRAEASALRRDIKQAQALIDRLQRRYPNSDERTQQHPTGRQRRAMADRQAK